MKREGAKGKKTAAPKAKVDESKPVASTSSIPLIVISDSESEGGFFESD